MFFNLSYLNSNLALTLGYLNPTLNNWSLLHYITAIKFMSEKIAYLQRIWKWFMLGVL